MKQAWQNESRPAKHWNKLSGDIVQCTLCPRHCKISEGKFGFCQVRGNVNNALNTFIYEKSVTATEEVIETEAVYHYMPGARTLSLGNISCMFNCDFCQNWQTSQVEHLDPRVVHNYTSEQIVNMALKHGIKVLSWTYNDPVVWHEFVVDTAKLAKDKGLKNLYKSAFYIEETPVSELIEVMDIFSISLKSMSDSFYKQHTGGRLQPVLDRINQVHQSKAHLEISQLLIPRRNEREEDVHKTVDWVLDTLGPEIPLHFVAFHPAYKYLEVERTSLETLMMAKSIAREKGVKYCYLGNIFEEGLTDTFCSECSNLLVRRFGLKSQVPGLEQGGKCKNCGHNSSIVLPLEGVETTQPQDMDGWSACKERSYTWDKEIKNIHLATPASFSDTVRIRIQREPGNRNQVFELGGDGLRRMIVSRSEEMERKINVSWDKDIELEFMPVLDRAHFPVAAAISDSKQTNR